MKRLATSCRQLIFAAGALSFTLPIQALPAQGPGLFDAFAARKDRSSDPVFAGLGIGGYSGMFGLRLSGSLNFNHGDNSTVNSGAGSNYRCDRFGCRTYHGQSYNYDSGIGIGVGGWSADVDLLIAPFRTLPVAKSLLLGFSPYAFVAIGGMGVNPTNARDTTRATWSFGAGVHHDLLGWLGVNAEARNRRSLYSDSVIAIGTSRSWEYRLGMSVSFGSSHRTEITTYQTHSLIMPIEQPAVDRFETAESAARTTARILDLAESYVDTPFLSGGTNPSVGFDAAGFVQYVFARERVMLPRTAHAIAELGEDVSTRIGSLRPGDLLFFGNDGSSIDHVAIYAGHDRIIHATASAGNVRYDVLGEGPRGEWFADHLVTARRILAEGRARPRVRRDDSRGQGEMDRPDRAPRAGRGE
jgi:cell wall-associated NlpC family hydrolase